MDRNADIFGWISRKIRIFIQSFSFIHIHIHQKMKGLHFLHSRRINPWIITGKSCQINVISYSVDQPPQNFMRWESKTQHLNIAQLYIIILVKTLYLPPSPLLLGLSASLLSVNQPPQNFMRWESKSHHVNLVQLYKIPNLNPK